MRRRKNVEFVQSNVQEKNHANRISQTLEYFPAGGQ